MKKLLPLRRYPRLIDVYESAASAYQILDRLCKKHGSEAIEKLLPSITELFDQLEHIATCNDSNKIQLLKDDLIHALNQIDALRNERIVLTDTFNTDLDGVVTQWRKETAEFEVTENLLREDVRKLNTQYRNRQFDLQLLKSSKTDVLSESDEMYFSNVRSVVKDMKLQVIRRDNELKEVHAELDHNMVELNSAVSLLQQVKKRNLQQEHAFKTEQKSDLLAGECYLELRVAMAEDCRAKR